MRDPRPIETITDAPRIDAVRDEIVHYCDLGEQVIDQTRRRVIDGEQVPNEEEIFSIFETHTDLIKRGKVRKPVEFGHKVFLAESAIGLITQYEVLIGTYPPLPSGRHLGCSARQTRQAWFMRARSIGAWTPCPAERNLCHPRW
jgi:transposase, IS5 family